MLLNEDYYSQKEICEKLNTLGVNVSRASISNLRHEKRPVSQKLKRKVAKGLLELIEKEHCLRFNERKRKFVKIPKADCQPRKINIIDPRTNKSMYLKKRGYLIHDGRQNVHEIIHFYQKAKYEVIEIGIRLGNFKNHFKDQRESAFIQPLKELLEAGVNFKCYVLDPQGNMAKRYVDDRSVVQPFEKDIIDSIPKIAKELGREFDQLNRLNFKGKIQLFQYDHIPYYHASIVDGTEPHGEMMIAPYLYGLTRANTPVIQLSRKSNEVLFKKYWRSIQSLIGPERSKKTIG
ncbi:MAG: hypothetical protein AAF985_11785 [Bacteroidota bacterium]